MAADSSIALSLQQHLASLASVATRIPTIERIAQAMTDALRAGGKVLTCGNGGSAAEALHLAEEMMGRFSMRRRSLAAVCLAADPTALTCIANDYGFEEVFARQVESLAKPGDVLIVLTTSGRSRNILRALEQARGMGIRTIGLLGPEGSPADACCDIALTGDGMMPAHVQEMHLIAIHLVLEYLDEAFA